MKKLYGIILLFTLILGIPANSAGFSTKDVPTKEAEYLKRVEKNRIKELYGRKIMDRIPSGFMSMEDYEQMSAPKDKALIDYGTPQIDKPYDMQYVPHPTYKLARYNDPPGSPDLSVKRELFQTGQLNLPGITSPDFTLMVYPAVYYYPEREAVSCDLFMVALRDNDSSVNKILKANIANRYPVPILSTDKELSNSSAYRTLTPIDFSQDSKYFLVKEKTGSSEDGIWQTKAIVYDFSNNTSYDLVELREAIVYYWKQYKGLDLNDKRWDIYPLGFSKGNPDRVLVTSYAYTGDTPVFLGVWSIDVHGEQSRLISMQNGSIEVASNGFKIVKDGVEDKTLSQIQEKNERNYEKLLNKEAKKADRAEVKSMKTDMKNQLKEVNHQYKLEREEYNLRYKLKGATTETEMEEKYQKLLDDLYEKRRLEAESEEKHQQKKEQKLTEKNQKKQLKAQKKAEKDAEKSKEQDTSENEEESSQPKTEEPIQLQPI